MIVAFSNGVMIMLKIINLKKATDEELRTNMADTLYRINRCRV
jgi:hypothetical protein